jgi:hypothetical protein
MEGHINLLRLGQIFKHSSVQVGRIHLYIDVHLYVQNAHMDFINLGELDNVKDAY